MFLILFLALLVALFVFRKQVWAWLQSANDPLAGQFEKLDAQEKAVFGKRAVPPAASVGDPDLTTKKE